jgi:hypothetical protein
MFISPNSPLPVTLGSAGQLQAPAENVANFQALLSGVNNTLSKGTASLQEKPSRKEWAGVSLLEDTALRVGQSEKIMEHVIREINAKTSNFKNEENMGGDFVVNMLEQKLLMAYQFVGLSRAGNDAQDFSEELQSITKGR